MRTVLLFATTLFTTIAVAQSRPPVTAHPAIPQFGTDPLLVVEFYESSCYFDEIQVNATAAQVVIQHRVTSPPPGRACNASTRLVREIVSPRQFFPASMPFANPLAVRYEYVFDGNLIEVVNTSIAFGFEQPAPITFASGTFIARDTHGRRLRDKSGLFIDHQGSGMSATLVDYDAVGKPLWWVAADVVNGSAFQSAMRTLSAIPCGLNLCPTRVADLQGDVSAVILDQDTVLVHFRKVLAGVDSATFEYRRVKFSELEHAP